MQQLPIHYEELEAVYATSVGQGNKAIAVVSAVQGEGVSTLAYALARRAAANGKKTLLVDFNTARPSVAPRLGYPDAAWRPANQTWKDAAIDCGIGLSLLPAPVGSEGVLNLRETSRLKSLVDEWECTFEVVIFDTSPLTSANQANIPPERIAAIADGSILVTLAARTAETKVTEALSKLRSADARLLGSVLNDRYNPGVADELCRETHRLDRFVPNLMAAARRIIRAHPFLNQEI